MNKQILVAIAVILLVTSLALADSSNTWSQYWSSGLYGIQVLSKNTPLSQLEKYDAMRVYSRQSGGGNQVDVVQRNGVRAELYADAAGNLHVKTCGNPVQWIEALVPLPTPRNGRDGKDGANGRDGRDGTNGTNGLDGQNGNDAVCPEQPAKPECMRLPDRQSLPEQPQPRQCRPTFQPTLSVNFQSAEPRVTYAQFQREPGFGEQLLGIVGNVAAAYLGRAEGSVWNVAGGTAFGGNANATGGNGYGGSSSSVSQAGSSSYSNASNRNNIRLRNQQGQTQSAASQSNPTQNQALNAPVAVAVD